MMFAFTWNGANHFPRSPVWRSKGYTCVASATNTAPPAMTGWPSGWRAGGLLKSEFAGSGMTADHDGRAGQSLGRPPATRPVRSGLPP